MNHSEQILKARFEQLPEDVRKAIIATPWKDKLAQIASKHKLHIDQADRLGKETIIVMFGLDHPDNLIYNIAKNVEVSEEEATAIAEDLNNEIFLKIRESLKRVIEERVEEGEEKEKSFLASLPMRQGSSLSADEAGLLEKTKDKESKTETEEIPSREDILKEIEDKEHHNLPMVNKSELHLEAKLPSEIKVFEKPADSPNQNTVDDAKAETEKSEKTNSFINHGESEEEQKIFEKVNRNSNLEARLPSKEGAIKTMSDDIIKLKMSEVVNVPKETIEVKDSKLPPKKDLSGAGRKADPYREEVR